MRRVTSDTFVGKGIVRLGNDKSNKNIIDITSRLKPKKGTSSSKNSRAKAAPLVDITSTRQEQIQRERRQKRRIVLEEFLGAYIVVPEKGLQKVSLYDLSENGLAFDIGLEMGSYKKGENVAFRIYISKTSYIPFSLNIRNVRGIAEEGVYRHGASIFDQQQNKNAFEAFFRFVESASHSLKKDNCDLVINSDR